MSVVLQARVVQVDADATRKDCGEKRTNAKRTIREALELSEHARRACCMSTMMAEHGPGADGMRAHHVPRQRRRGRRMRLAGARIIAALSKEPRSVSLANKTPTFHPF